MVDIWNLRRAKAPPVCTVNTVVKQSDIMEILDIISDACSTYKNLKPFNVEVALLERFLYKFKRIFRQDKGIQQLAKVNQALGRFCQYRAIGAIKKFGSCFPEEIPPDGSEAYLPTQQLLKWVLMRLLCNAKLFLRIIDLCKDAGRYIYGRLYMGWGSSYMMFALSINSRILTFAKYLLIKTVEWYDRLRIHLPNFIGTCVFVNFEFPEKMADFIGDIDLTPPTMKADIDKIFELIDLTKGDDIDEDDDVILMDEMINADDYDNEFEVTNDDIIVESEKIKKKGKKRAVDDDVAVLYEKTRSSGPNLAPFSRNEDLGEPVRKKKRHKK